MFTRRHYVAIAKVMAEAGGTAKNRYPRQKAVWGVEIAVSQLADTFERDNDRFDRNRFIAACKVKDE